MDLTLVDLLSQAVEEYNEAQKDESKHLDWWEVIDGIADIKDESCLKNTINEIYAELTAIRIHKQMK